MAKKKTILVFSDWYLPGFRAGGPIQSCVNFVNNMKDRFSIFVFTSDRDLGQSEPYPGIKANEWLEIEDDVRIFYANAAHTSMKFIGNMIKSISPDFIYLNSMFSPSFTIKPLLINRFASGRHTIILAPRGMLRHSALTFKPTKKKVFLYFLKWMGIQNEKLKFHATDDTEVEDIGRYFPKATIVKAPNFPRQVPEEYSRISKMPGKVQLVYVGRIHPIKNLHVLLEAAGRANGDIELTVVGAVEDQEYFLKCQKILKSHGNIRVHFKGELQHHLVADEMRRSHALALPTSGENFGHAIFESFTCGRPVLISDQTPWRNLENYKAGWDFSLESDEIVDAINALLEMDEKKFREWCEGAINYAKMFVSKSELLNQYILLFDEN